MFKQKLVAVVGPSVLILLVNSFFYLPFVVNNTPSNWSSDRHHQHSLFDEVLGSSTSSSDAAAGTTKKSTNANGNSDATWTTTNNFKNVSVDEEEHLRQHPHPHAGAKDAQGQWGYIHDAKFLRRQPNLHPFNITDNERDQICAPPGHGPEGGLEDYQLLTEHIEIQQQQQQSDIKLFCAVYTHAGSSPMTEAALETWAQRCDGFMAASTVTDAARGMVHIPHGGNHYGQYKGIWQKVRSMMTYIYTHYGNDYDYFHFNGDDVFLIVENLKSFLQEKRPQYVGMWRSAYHLKHWWKTLAEAHPDFYYPLGGAGYTLSRETLRLLVQELFPVCEATTDESEEDYYVARCLWPAGIRAEPYWDETGANMYNPGSWTFYQKHVLSKFDWKKSRRIISRHHKLPAYGNSMSKAISKSSVSFHLVKTPALMRRYERLIYRRSNGTDCGIIS